MKLSDYFNALCDDHELSSISVGIHIIDGRATYHAYAHWKPSAGRCASADGDSPEEAMAKAVAEANALRGRGIVIPDALEAEQAA